MTDADLRSELLKTMNARGWSDVDVASACKLNPKTVTGFVRYGKAGNNTKLRFRQLLKGEIAGWNPFGAERVAV